MVLILTVSIWVSFYYKSQHGLVQSIKCELAILTTLLYLPLFTGSTNRTCSAGFKDVMKGLVSQNGPDPRILQALSVTGPRQNNNNNAVAALLCQGFVHQMRKTCLLVPSALWLVEACFLWLPKSVIVLWLKWHSQQFRPDLSKGGK